MNDLEKAITELATLTNQSIGIHTSAINDLKANITYLQQKSAEHQTQLSELFGGTPSRIAERFDGLRGHIARLDAVDEDVHQRLDDIHAALRDTLTPTLEGALRRLDTEIADKLDALQAACQEHEHRLTELEATTKEHAGFISDDRGKYNDHRNDPDAHTT